MYTIITILTLAFLFYYIVMVKHGHLSFWKKAAKNPDFVYKQLLRDDAWIIGDDTVQVDKNEYDGPFYLYVPSIGKTIKFYGRIDQYEASQNKIEEQLSCQ